MNLSRQLRVQVERVPAHLGETEDFLGEALKVRLPGMAANGQRYAKRRDVAC